MGEVRVIGGVGREPCPQHSRSDVGGSSARAMEPPYWLSRTGLEPCVRLVSPKRCPYEIRRGDGESK
jgi:hypothetical protein